MSGGGGGGGGGAVDCFISNSLVTMANGKLKKIVDVQVGDEVFNYDKTSCNKVRYIEQVTGNMWAYMYTPTDDHVPFATINHPMYINGILSSVDPVQSYKIYPWLGKLSKINPAKVITTEENYNDKIYNLWVDGDGTYIVNGFGTTSIVGTGGLFKAVNKCIDEKLITVEEMQNVFERTSKASINNPNLLIGLYALGEFLIKLNNKNLFKLLVKLQPKKDTDEMRLPLKLFLLTLGFICSKTKWKK